MKKYDMIEIIAVSVCLLFAIVISLYHLSFDGYLGLNRKAWNVIWAFAENGFAFTLSIIISLYLTSLLRLIFRYVFAPYFGIKLIYHFTCLSGIVIFPASVWTVIWSVILVLFFIISLIYVLVLIRKRNA